MTKRQARAELRAKLKGMVERGEPLPVRLRIARSQMSLRGVTPQFMLRAGEFLHQLPHGVMLCPDGAEVHDMWRPLRAIECTWSLMSHADQVIFGKFTVGLAGRSWAQRHGLEQTT